MEIHFNISALFEQVWGYKSSAFDPKAGKVTGDNVFTRTEVGKVAQSPYYAKDVNGREYYLPIEVQVGFDKIPGTETTYAEALGIQNQDGSYTGRWNLPYPVMSATNKKLVIDTPLTERRGFVSEYINTEAWRISVKGLVIGKGNEYPEADVATLIRLYNMNIPIKVNNVVSDMLLLSPDNTGSDLVTIRSLNFPGREGVKHVRAYELELVSEAPFNLIDIS